MAQIFLKEFFPFIISLLLMIATSFIFYFLTRLGKTPSEPTNWPVVGMMPCVLQNMHCAHAYVTEVLNQTGGTFLLKGPWFCNLDMLFTCDPANIHHIFSKNFPNYPKGPEFRRIFDILGDGIFNADFELWEFHRKTTQYLLTRPGFSASLEGTVWDKVETGLLPVLDGFCATGQDLDLQDIFQRFAFDNICKLALDEDPCSLSSELPHVACDRAFNQITEPLLHRHVIPETILKLQKWLRIGNERVLSEANRAFDEFIYPRVLRFQNQGDEADATGFKVLKAFEKGHGEKNIGSSTGNTRDFLRDTALNLILAGRDTTSTCLTWLFWLVATNPSKKAKILEEIETALDLKEWRFFNVEESRKLTYLHAALCESLRLFPPVALEHKSPVEADYLPSGVPLKRHTKIIVSFYSVGRMESVWGKDCLEFKPERWITPSGGIKHEPSYKFPAFNAGPRTCLGKEMAFIQMKMVAAAILYRYNVRLVEGHPVVPRDSIILQARDGLKVTLSKRIV